MHVYLSQFQPPPLNLQSLSKQQLKQRVVLAWVKISAFFCLETEEKLQPSIEKDRG